MFEKSVLGLTSPSCDCATSPACLLTVSSKPPVSRGFAHRAATWLDYRQNADELGPDDFADDAQRGDDVTTSAHRKTMRPQVIY